MDKGKISLSSLNAWHWFSIITVFALLFRVGYLLTVVGDPLFNYLPVSPDSDMFDRWATNMVESGDWWGEGVFFIGPLYAYFLAVVYSIFGHSLFAVRVIQIFMGAITAGVVFATADRTFGRTAGLVAGFVMAVYLPAVFFGALVLPTTVILFRIAVGLYFLILGIDFRRPWPFVLAGLALGGAVLGRPNLLLFIAVLAIIMFLVKRNGFHWKLVTAFIAPAILMVAFTFTHNLIEEDDPVLVSSQAGINFYIGNSPNASGIYYTPIVDMDRPEELNRFGARVVAEAATGKTMKPSQVSRWWFVEGLKFLRDNPGDAFSLYVRKVRLLTNDYEAALNYDYYFTRTISVFHRVPVPWFALVFALGIMGVIAARGKYGYKGMVLTLFAGLYALSILVFFVTSRYRMPLVLPLILFSGLSVHWFVEAVKRRLWVKSVISVIGVIALLIASLWPVSGFSRRLGYADVYYKYAKLYYDAGDMNTTIGYLERSLDENPEHYQSLNKLALIYGRAGDYDKAGVYYKKAVDIRPDDPLANFNYGMSLYEQKDLVLAGEYFSIAAELNPKYALAWRYYAECLVNTGDIETAVIALENVITLIPGDAQARVRLAEIYFDTGEYERARNQAELALKVNDKTPGANLVIAKYLFIQGRFNEGMSFLTAEQQISGNTTQVLLTYTETMIIMGYPEDAVKYYEAYLAGGGQPIPRFEGIR
ncbi:MAG: tetratricopeptide repeat protein [bacterium]|nr:tetratricopeptide repeat protein [bacterium]